MANRIKVAKDQVILGSWRQGHSRRRVACLVGMHRETVTRYVEQERTGAKPASPTLGSDGLESPNGGPPGLEAEELPGSSPAKAAAVRVNW